MEVFRYITEDSYRGIESSGQLSPRNVDGLIYAIPEDKSLWDDEATKSLLDFIQRISHSRAVLLIKFLIDDFDPEAWVQDGYFPPWSKSYTRKPLLQYRGIEYINPEVIIAHPILNSEVTIVEKISLSAER